MGEVIALPVRAVVNEHRAHLGAVLRLARGEVTQVELARRLGMGQPAISAWEAGRVRLGLDQVWAVETALGLKHGWIMAAAGLCDPDLEPLMVLLDASCRAARR